MENKETLEKTAEKYANDWEEIHPKLDFEAMTPIAISKIDFIEGAKWQQERMYIEEDMLEFSEWVSDNDWVYLPSKGCWVNEEEEESEEKFTTKELFNKFKNK